MNATISTRGVAFAEKRPLFFEVLDNLWHPQSNPDGIVNLGLAENVSQAYWPSILHARLSLCQCELTWSPVMLVITTS